MVENVEMEGMGGGSRGDDINRNNSAITTVMEQEMKEYEKNVTIVLTKNEWDESSNAMKILME